VVSASRGASLALVLFAVFPVARASADDEAPPSHPQANVGITAGAVGVGSGHVWQETKLFVGGRGDVLFGRSSNLSWGVGPMAGIGTYGFRDLSVQVGGSLLIPVQELFPFVLSAGPFLRRDGEWDPGVFGALFWGNRSFNYHSDYVLAGGLIVEGRYGVGDARERTIIVSAHIDGEIFLLPAVLLLNAFR
jgi:hypothetical protein